MRTRCVWVVKTVRGVAQCTLLDHSGSGLLFGSRETIGADLVGQSWSINTLRPRQNGRHFADDVFKCIFLNENVWILLKISLKFVPQGPINNIPSLVQIMAWRRPGDKLSSEPMMVCLLTHICVTRPQWVKIGIVRSKCCFPPRAFHKCLGMVCVSCADWKHHSRQQATVLDARASRVKWPAQFMSQWYGILFTE